MLVLNYSAAACSSHVLHVCYCQQSDRDRQQGACTSSHGSSCACLIPCSYLATFTAIIMHTHICVCPFNLFPLGFLPQMIIYMVVCYVGVLYVPLQKDSISYLSSSTRPCLVLFKIPKFYKILHHIEFFNACMKYQMQLNKITNYTVYL